MMLHKTAWYAFYEAVFVLNRPRIWVPLLLYALIKIGVVVSYVATVRGPLGTFWGVFLPGKMRESIEHYPWDMTQMPIILNRVDIILDIFVHVIFQGAVILLFSRALESKTLSLRSAFRGTMRQYLPLVGVTIVAAVAVYGAILLPGFVAASSPVRIPGTVLRFGTPVLALAIQAFFVFTMPLILLSGATVFGAIRGSFVLTGKAFFNTFALVLVPFFLSYPAIYLDSKSGTFVNSLSPDILVHIQIAIELMQWLATLVLLGAVTANFRRRYEQ